VWRADDRNSDWVGVAVGTALGLKLKHPAGKARTKALIRAWTETIQLVEKRKPDQLRKLKVFVEIGPNGILS
jgi:hypothetical protein